MTSNTRLAATQPFWKWAIFGPACPRLPPPMMAARRTVMTCPPVYSPAVTRVLPYHRA